jgi:4-hydroxy-3-methylbut-2-enyl diphosphate reductase
MAEIIVAPHAGFCFGVRRAIALAEKVSAEEGGKRIWSMGPLIHNPQEVQRLRGLGVEVMASEEDAKDGDTVIIRSHGIPPQKERELLQKGLKLVDATCPYVKAVHQAVGYSCTPCGFLLWS